MSVPVELHTPAVLDISHAQQWTGRVLSALAVLFLTADAIGKLLRPAAVVDGTKQLGWPEETILTLGVLQLVCLIAYIVPRTSVLGAILWTGYLGGAIATHLRLGNPLFSHILFPTYVAAFLWAGLWLRNRRLRELLPLTR
ncbi:MAG TPA: DoxX family protein [Thermoanaerobaculia bacterium]|nr:DoxX family protein [Thermoanaerobaculia bacterium]